MYAEKGVKLEPDGATGDVPGRLQLRGIEDDAKPVDLGVEVHSNWVWNQLSWAPDGTAFFVNRSSSQLDQATFASTTTHAVTGDTTAGKELWAKQFTNQEPLGWWTDGKAVVLSETAGDRFNGFKLLLSRYDLATGKTTALWSMAGVRRAMLSPDAAAVLWFGTSAAGGGTHGAVFRYDFAAKTTAEIVTHEQPGYLDGRWSHDGTRIAYQWAEVDGTKEKPVFGPWRLVVCDADGKNAVTLRTDADSPGVVVAWTRTPPQLKGAKPLPKAK